MPRLMSVAFTEGAVRDRTKTVTRRKGWMFLKPGDRLTLCRKVMGRKPGEPLVRICDVEVVHVSREPLERLLSFPGVLHRSDYALKEVALEGFPGMDPDDFVNRFFVVEQGMNRDDYVTRIEWRYLDEPEGGAS